MAPVRGEQLQVCEEADRGDADRDVNRAPATTSSLLGTQRYHRGAQSVRCFVNLREEAERGRLARPLGVTHEHTVSGRVSRTRFLALFRGLWYSILGTAVGTTRVVVTSLDTRQTGRE